MSDFDTLWAGLAVLTAAAFVSGAVFTVKRGCEAAYRDGFAAGRKHEVDAINRAFAEAQREMHRSLRDGLNYSELPPEADRDH